jgi:hypothetical protein
VLKTILWAILAVWVGIALVILGMLVVSLVSSILRTIRDRRGVKGSVYCPVHERTLAVVGVPTSFGTAPFDDVRRCEAFDEGGVRCEKVCLKVEQAKSG